MKYLFSLLLFLFQISAFCQFYTGTITEDYQIRLKETDSPLGQPRSNPPIFTQLDGFPLSFPNDPSSPNLRNITLEDINNDGIQDFLFSANNILYAYSNDTPLWEKAMVGTGIYPPSIADIDNDGDMEIIQVTGGNGKKGRIYAVDHLGNNLPGFPKNYDDNWIITTATLADLDIDGQMEIIFLERNPPNGFIHILDNKGEIWNSNWPIRISGTPAITPSVGDIDNDGRKEIVIASTTVLYAFDLEGQLKEGWPVVDSDTRFSFQSPILVDLDEDGTLEIVGAAHGISPQFYIKNHDGTDFKSWPFFVPENTTSFTTPTVIEEQGEYQIIMSRPSPVTPINLDKIYKWDTEGNLAIGYPIEDELGSQGIITVANIDADEEMEIIFSTNTFTEEGNGFIHAMNLDGSGAVEGFPILVNGFTMMNGAAIGDINGDGQMDLTALGYNPGFEGQPRLAYINSFDLGTPYSPEKILWNTYKGSNTRDGNLDKSVVSSIYSPKIEGLSLDILPNPIYEKGSIKMELSNELELTGNLISANGQFSEMMFKNYFIKGVHEFQLPALIPGVYFLVVNDVENRITSKKIIIAHK